MITPQFEVLQDENSVTVKIRAPYIKASMVQFEVQDNVFVFSLPPYYLRLRFPGNIVEDEHMYSRYDMETSYVTCKVSKKVPGEHFDDLDMLSKLLATKAESAKSRDAVPRISEISTKEELETAGRADDDLEFGDDIEIEQQVPQPLIKGVHYGFNDQYTEIIGVSVHEGNEINELEDPESASLDQRRAKCDEARESFDGDHYLADLYDNNGLAEMLAWSPPSNELNAQERDILLQLPQRQYLLENPKATYLGILQLLFGQAYEARMNLGDSTVESAWTVGKLTPVMATLYNSFRSVGEVVRACSVRALVFPLVRNWELVVASWRDVLNTLRSGRLAILQRFVQLLSWFQTDIAAHYRRILLEDYSVWIQYASDGAINSLSTELEAYIVQFGKGDLDLDLEEWEEAAAEAIAQQDQHEEANIGDSDDEDD